MAALLHIRRCAGPAGRARRRGDLGVALGWTHPAFGDGGVVLVLLGALAGAIRACLRPPPRVFVAACLLGFLSVGALVGSVAAADVVGVAAR